MPLRVIFTRHGESTANIDGIFANRVEIPGDLTPAGKAQARELAGRLAAMGATHLYASPLPRAAQTAEIVSAALGLPFTVTDALREYDVGEFEGFPYTGDDAWRMEAYWEIDRAWASGDIDARHPGGESLSDLLGRFVPFMNSLPGLHSDFGVVVTIGHGGLYRAVLPHLFPVPPESILAREALRHGEMILTMYEAAGWRFERRIPPDSACPP